MYNYKIVLCYDGTRYRGWQKQGNTHNTIQEKIEAILTAILNETIHVSASGRTDAGVHARKQIISFHSQKPLDLEATWNCLKKQLPKDIGVYELSPVPDRFHARYSCIQKTYRYFIWNSNMPCIFNRDYRFIVNEQLDLEKMRKASKTILGKHDFSAFTSSRNKKHSAIRSIHAISIDRIDSDIVMDFTGDGFLYNMVRILVGTLIEIGLNQRDPDSIQQAFLSGKRCDTGFTAPSSGLFLWDLEYIE